MTSVPRPEDVKAASLRIEREAEGRVTLEQYVETLAERCEWVPMPRERRLAEAERLYAEAGRHLAAGRVAESLDATALANEIDPRLHDDAGEGEQR